MQNKILLVIIISGIFLFNSCDAPSLVDVPLPFIEFVNAPNPGEMLKNDHTFFKWRGNNSDYVFKYQLNIKNRNDIFVSYLSDSNLTKSSEVFFKDLDEGEYKIEVTGISSGMIGVINRIFSVNAITEPSMIFYKKSNIIDVDSTVSLSLGIENIDSVSAISLSIAYTNNIINLENVENGPFVIKNRFQQIILPTELRQVGSSIITKANNVGEVEIHTGFLTSLSANYANSISGSGNVLILKFKAIAKGEATIEYTSITLLRPDGSKISTRSNATAKIIVK